MTVERALLASLAALALASCAPPQPPKVYANADWGFRVTYPNAPKLSGGPVSPGSAARTFVAEDDEGGGKLYTVIVAEPVDGTVDDYERDISAKTAQAVHGQASAATNVSTAEGVAGREDQITSGGGQPVLVQRHFLYGGRSYVVSAGDPDGPDDAAVKTFLDSFHLTAAMATPPAANAN